MPRTASASPSPSAAAVEPVTRAAVQRLLDAARGGGPGAVLRVSMSGDGPRGVHRVASGCFQRDATRLMKPTDQFRIASISKTFTAVVVLRLCEQRRLRLDSRISAYLDAGLVDRLNVIDSVSYGPQITVRHLLTHTSGIPDYAMNADYIAAVKAHPRKRWTAMEQVEFALTHRKACAAPSESFAYADTNYVLLAMIVEDITGRSLADNYQRYILTPLRLHDTYLEGRQSPRGPGLSHAYYGVIDTTSFDPSFDTNGGGGLVSTADDLATFVTALVQGKVFDDPTTLETMLTPTPQSESAGSGYGCGVEIDERHGVRWVGHSGFFSSFMYCAPERGIVVTGTLNQVALISHLSELIGTLQRWLPARGS